MKNLKYIVGSEVVRKLVIKTDLIDESVQKRCHSELWDGINDMIRGRVLGFRNKVKKRINDKY